MWWLFAGLIGRPLLDVSTGRGYDIACALRGPDISGPDGSAPFLKGVLTERIRFLASKGRCIGGRSQKVKGEFASEAIREAARLRSGNPRALTHWLGHVHAAALRLNQKDLAELAAGFSTGRDLNDETVIALAGGK